MAKKRLILGIDLGTTFSLACMRIGNEQFHFFTPEAGGDQLVPSVFLHKKGKDGKNDEILVGAAAEAEEHYEEDRGQVVRHVKRYMSRNYQDGDQEPHTFSSNDKEYLPHQISGYILKALKEAAEAEIKSRAGEDIRKDYEWIGHIYAAVITVPAYFGPRERKATRDAAKFAGFSPANVELLDEPVAAALSLNLHQQKGKRIVLVVDIGGGTTDITLLKIGKDVENGGIFELGRIGDVEFGGIDIDRKIVNATIYSPISRKQDRYDRYSVFELDALEDYTRQGPFFQKAEDAKKNVCREMREKKGAYGEVRYRELAQNVMFQFKFNEQWLRTETEYFVEYCAQLCDDLLKNVDRREAGRMWPGHGISWKQVDEVWMVGGTSLMPHLQERFVRRLRDPKKLRVAPRPQHAVAEGAGIYADMLARNQALKGIAMPRCPRDIGVMGIPRTGWWKKLRQKLFLEEKIAETRKEFFPLIRSNTMLSDESKRTQEFQAKVLPGADGNSYIYLRSRFVRRQKNETDPKNGHSSSDMHYEIRHLKRLPIPNLQPVEGCTDLDTVFLTVTYEPTHTLQFKAKFRGHNLPPFEAREGEF